MREYDRLPSELRCWLAGALLPWGPKSAKQAYARALSQTRDPEKALHKLSRIEARLIAKDIEKIWGAEHPYIARRR